MSDHTILPITDVCFTPTTPETRESGLMGFLAFRYHALRLDGIALRRTADGRPALSFPERTDRTGRRHAIVRPVDDEARQRFEHEVFVALGLCPPADGSLAP